MHTDVHKHWWNHTMGSRVLDKLNPTQQKYWKRNVTVTHTDTYESYVVLPHEGNPRRTCFWPDVSGDYTVRVTKYTNAACPSDAISKQMEFTMTATCPTIALPTDFAVENAAVDFGVEAETVAVDVQPNSIAGLTGLTFPVMWRWEVVPMTPVMPPGSGTINPLSRSNPDVAVYSQSNNSVYITQPQNYDPAAVVSVINGDTPVATFQSSRPISVLARLTLGNGCMNVTRDFQVTFRPRNGRSSQTVTFDTTASGGPSVGADTFYLNDGADRTQASRVDGDAFVDRFRSNSSVRARECLDTDLDWELVSYSASITRKNPPPPAKHRLGHGAIAGISIGAVLGTGLIVAGALFVFRRYRSMPRTPTRRAAGRSTSTLNPVGHAARASMTQQAVPAITATSTQPAAVPLMAMDSGANPPGTVVPPGAAV
jgi:hypothetical protein